MKALGMLDEPPPQKVRTGAGFAGWADDSGGRCARCYPLVAVRDAAHPGRTLSGERYAIPARAGGGRMGARCWTRRWTITNSSAGCGWEPIVDCLASPESAGRCGAGGDGLADQRGVDLIVSNQSHAAWRQGMADAGFRAGPFELPGGALAGAGEGSGRQRRVAFQSRRRRRADSPVTNEEEHAGALDHVSRRGGERRFRIERISRRRRARVQTAARGFRAAPGRDCGGAAGVSRRFAN